MIETVDEFSESLNKKLRSTLSQAISTLIEGSETTGEVKSS